MSKINISKPWLLALSALLVVGAAGATFAYNYNQNQKTEPSGQAENVNLNPPTDQDKEEAARHKEELVNKPAEPPKEDNSSTPKTVTPVITSWGQSNSKVEVAARVPGVFESGGKCTLTLKKGGQTVTGTSNGTENVSEVSCGFIAIPRSSLSPGEWSATVAYSSAKAQGTSQAKNITVK